LETYKTESNYNNNYQLQSFESKSSLISKIILLIEVDEKTKKVRAMPTRPPVTKIDNENLGESLERLRTRDTNYER
jgi:hypothetical protein